MISHPTVQLVFFRLYLVLHTYAARFDVMYTVQTFLETKQALSRDAPACLAKVRIS